MRDNQAKQPTKPATMPLTGFLPPLLQLVFQIRKPHQTNDAEPAGHQQSLLVEESR